MCSYFVQYNELEMSNMTFMHEESKTKKINLVWIQNKYGCSDETGQKMAMDDLSISWKTGEVICKTWFVH